MPTSLGWLLTVALLAVAGYAIAQLAAASRTAAVHGCDRPVHTAHAVMALGMAVMCSPVGGPLPMAGWLTVFVLLTAWFLVRREPAASWHGGGVQHAIAGLAMIYMLSAVPHSAHAMSSAWSPRMSAGGAALPLLGWAFVAYFTVQVVRLAPLIARPGSLRIAAACQCVMALGTGGLIAVML
jgi:hypothetical protein